MRHIQQVYWISITIATGTIVVAFFINLESIYLEVFRVRVRVQFVGLKFLEYVFPFHPIQVWVKNSLNSLSDILDCCVSSNNHCWDFQFFVELCEYLFYLCHICLMFLNMFLFSFIEHFLKFRSLRVLLISTFRHINRRPLFLRNTIINCLFPSIESFLLSSSLEFT